jgi:hypothetical protein
VSTRIITRPFALAAAVTTPAVPEPQPPASPPLSNLWKGVIGIEGTCTGDGRMIEPGALGWQDLPIPIRYVAADKGAHEGAQVVGRILTLARDGALIIGTGDFDMGSEIGQEAQRQVALELTTGVSMDLDNISFEFRVSAELMGDPDDAMFDDLDYAGRARPFAEDYPPEEADIGGPGGAQTDAEQPPPGGRVTVAQFAPDDELEVTTSARIRAVTIVSLPAFAECRIGIIPAEPAVLGPDSPQAAPAPEQEQEPEQVTTGPAPIPVPSGTLIPDHALAASAVPVAPPAAWFADPRFSEPTALAVFPDGRVRGHLAEWGTCHTGYADQCVSPPASKAGYAYFRTGAILTSEGTEIAVGQLTMDTRHAAPEAGASSAMRHYDHTGTAVADVASGEDAFGIWVAGALRPGLTPAQVRILRASPLSGDWRRIGGSLELIAALAVNVQGFPVPRTAGLVASGRLQTLTASGMLAPRKVIPPGTPGAFSPDDLRYLQRVLAREKAEAAARARSMALMINEPKRRAVLASASRVAALLAAAPLSPPPSPGQVPAGGACDEDGKMIPDTPKGTPPDPSWGGWLVRGGMWVFDPENDGDDDYQAATDSDHDYWAPDGKQLKPIPASPDGQQEAKPLPSGQPPDKGPKQPAAKAGQPRPDEQMPRPASSAVRISLRAFGRLES